MEQKKYCGEVLLRLINNFKYAKSDKCKIRQLRFYVKYGIIICDEQFLLRLISSK